MVSRRPGLQTADGTAIALEDYEPVGGTASVPSLDTVTIVHIPIVNDWIEEPTEEFFLGLSGAVNAGLITPTVTITIDDDDAGIIFGDGFESGNTTRWTAVTP